MSDEELIQELAANLRELADRRFVDGARICELLALAKDRCSDTKMQRLRKMAALEDAAGGVSVGGLAVDVGLYKETE